MKKRLAFALAAIFAISSLSGCSKQPTESELLDQIAQLESELEKVQSSSDNTDQNSGSTLAKPDASGENENSDLPAQENNESEIQAPQFEDEEYPELFDVMPEIEITPLRNFVYEYDETLGGIVITNYISNSKEVRVPDTIDEKPVLKVCLGDIEVTTLYLPDTVKDVECNTKSLETYNIPSAYEGEVLWISIGNVNQVYLNTGITEIPDDAFSSNRNLIFVGIPNTVTRIGNEAFAYCKNLKFINKYDDLNMDYHLPEGITEIGEEAFVQCDNLYINRFPSNLKKIGNNAFAYCNELIRAVFPDGLKEIGEFAFYSCDNLEIVWIPDSVTEIGEHAFNDCERLETITLSNSLSVIKRDLFSYTALTQIEIPDSVTCIEHDVFSGTSIKEVTIPDSVTEISEHAFNNSSLEKITFKGETYPIEDVQMLYDAVNLPNGYEADGTTFVCCSSNIVGNYEIPEGITSIGSYAFTKCKGLTSVTIPDYVTDVYVTAFDDSSVKKIIYKGETYPIEDFQTFYDIINCPNGYKVDGTTFVRCSAKNVGHFEIPEGVTSIEWRAFEDCKGLTSVTIPDSVKKIDKYAFSNCTGLTSISIPDSVEYIGEGAFKNCSELKSVTLPDNIRLAMDTTPLGRGEYYIECDVFLGCININVTYKGQTYAFKEIGNEIEYLYMDIHNANAFY